MRDTFLPYCRPCIAQDEATAAGQAILAGWVTTGPQTTAFEKAFAAACGVEHAVALNSCTAGLHLALAALGLTRLEPGAAMAALGAVLKDHHDIEAVAALLPSLLPEAARGD